MSNEIPRPTADRGYLVCRPIARWDPTISEALGRWRSVLGPDSVWFLPDDVRRVWSASPLGQNMAFTALMAGNETIGVAGTPAEVLDALSDARESRARELASALQDYPLEVLTFEGHVDQ